MILSERFIRYFIVAVLAYVIDLGGYWLLINHGMFAPFANVIVKIVAAIFGFFMHRMVTYQLKEAAGIRSHAIKYFGLALAYSPTSSVVLYFLMMVIPSPVMAKITSDIILFIGTYTFTTCFVFTSHTSTENSDLR